MNKYREKGDAMAETKINLRAEKVNDKMFDIFNESGEKVFIVYVQKNETYPWVKNECDNCKKIVYGIGYIGSIDIESLADADSKPVDINESPMTQIALAIMVWCIKSHCSFICDDCLDKKKQN
jgi:hypothetical protein